MSPNSPLPQSPSAQLRHELSLSVTPRSAPPRDLHLNAKPSPAPPPPPPPPPPRLTHLNADTSWLLQLPDPDYYSRNLSRNSESYNGRTSRRYTRRKYFNIVIDPWLSGSQVDIASWFSEQWHSDVPFVGSLKEVSALALGVEDGTGTAGGEDVEEEKGQTEVENEGGGKGEDEEGEASCAIDAVFIAHEFTDHCHKETLLQLPSTVPVYAISEALSIIKSWNHFTSASLIPSTSASATIRSEQDLPFTADLPPWLRVVRLVSESYLDVTRLHSALLIISETPPQDPHERETDREAEAEAKAEAKAEAPEMETNPSPAKAIIYTPHGLSSSSSAASLLTRLLTSSPHLTTLALLHGLHRIRLAHPLATAIVGPQLTINLGAENAYQLARALRAKYWIGTHDEVKTGKGIVGRALERRVWSEEERMGFGELEESTGGKSLPIWVDVANGECFLLE